MNDLDWPEVARFCVEMMMKYLYRIHIAHIWHLSDKGAGREAREKSRNSGEEIERVAKQH